MQKRCKSSCGGKLLKYYEDELITQWACEDCGRLVTQRKRQPYKLNAERDIIKIREKLQLLLKRNPIDSETTRAEWHKFINLYLADGLTLDKMIKQTIILPKKRKKVKLK